MKTASTVLCVFFACLMAPGAIAQDAGQIVFSTTPIDAASPGGLTDTIASGQPIYAVAILEKPLPALAGKTSASKVPVEIFLYELKAPLYDYQEPSEAQLETASLTVSGAALQDAHLPVDIVPVPDAMTAYGSPDLTYRKFGPEFAGPVKFAKRLGQLEPGEHEIIVRVKCNYQDVAEGRFTLKGDDYSSYAAQAGQINDAATGAKTRSTTMPAPAMSDPALEKEMIAAFTASQTYRDRIGGEVQRIVIIDPDWTIRRNQLTGAILHRYIRAHIAVKNDDGTCTLWQLVTFQQDYVGGAFQATKFDGVGDPVPIPCANVAG